MHIFLTQSFKAERPCGPLGLINDIICNISWISSEEIIRFTGFSNIHYLSSTPILCKDILEISFPIPPTMSFNVMLKYGP